MPKKKNTIADAEIEDSEIYVLSQCFLSHQSDVNKLAKKNNISIDEAELLIDEKRELIESNKNRNRKIPLSNFSIFALRIKIWNNRVFDYSKEHKMEIDDVLELIEKNANIIANIRKRRALSMVNNIATKALPTVTVLYLFSTISNIMQTM